MHGKGSWHPMKHINPVAGEQSVTHYIFDREMLGMTESGYDGGKGYKSQVQRPDAKNSADVEAAKIQLSRGFAFPQQKARNKVGAQGEEEINSIRAGSKDRDNQRPNSVRQTKGGVELGPAGRGMKHEDSEEGKEPENIKLGSVKASGSRSAPCGSGCCDGGAHLDFS